MSMLATNLTSKPGHLLVYRTAGVARSARHTCVSVSSTTVPALQCLGYWIGDQAHNGDHQCILLLDHNSIATPVKQDIWAKMAWPLVVMLDMMWIVGSVVLDTTEPILFLGLDGLVTSNVCKQRAPVDHRIDPISGVPWDRNSDLGNYINHTMGVIPTSFNWDYYLGCVGCSRYQIFICSEKWC